MTQEEEFTTIRAARHHFTDTSKGRKPFTRGKSQNITEECICTHIRKVSGFRTEIVRESLFYILHPLIQIDTKHVSLNLHHRVEHFELRKSCLKTLHSTQPD